jgi:hypothetical protein
MLLLAIEFVLSLHSSTAGQLLVADGMIACLRCCCSQISLSFLAPCAAKAKQALLQAEHLLCLRCS